MPFFSVIIPTYNRAPFIAGAVRSVLNQSYLDFELIIIDDASTDETESIVNGFSDNRIRYFKNEMNIERCKSRNKGISLATGRYICFLDSDDYHLPIHLEKLYDKISERSFPQALFFTNALNCDEEGVLTERLCPSLSDHNVFHYIVTYTFNPQRMCIHRYILEEFQFDPDVYVCEDVDLAARIATRYEVIQVPERTTVYVHHPSSFTGGDNRKPFKELENYKRIFAKPELLYKIPGKSKRRIKSMCYFHIAVYCDKNKQKGKMYKAILKSFFFFPRGYNGKTNKILFVMFLYNIPVLGKLFKLLRKSF